MTLPVLSGGRKRRRPPVADLLMRAAVVVGVGLGAYVVLLALVLLAGALS